MELFGIISLYLHFTGIDTKFFSSYRRFAITFGSLIVLTPLAVLGCIFSSVNLLLKIKKFNYYYHFILFSIIYLLFKYDLFICFPGFMYPNVLLNILASSIFLLLFGSLNLENKEIITIFIFHITKYTGGIYFIHKLFPHYMYYYWCPRKNYFTPFLIYIICYFICFLGNHFFYKNKLKYLFN